MFDGSTHTIFDVRYVSNLQKRLLLLRKFDEYECNFYEEKSIALVIIKKELIGCLYKLIEVIKINEPIVVTNFASIWHRCLGQVSTFRHRINPWLKIC